MTVHLLWKPRGLGVESAGTWEDMRRKESSGETKWGSWAGGRAKSVTVQVFPFLPPNSSFVLCTLLFSSKLLFLISS